MMTTPSQSPPLKEIGTAVGKHLHSTISKSEPGVLVDAQDRGGNRTMISVAIRIQAKHETQHVKVKKVYLFCSVLCANTGWPKNIIFLLSNIKKYFQSSITVIRTLYKVIHEEYPIRSLWKRVTFYK